MAIQTSSQLDRPEDVLLTQRVSRQERSAVGAMMRRCNALLFRVARSILNDHSEAGVNLIQRNPRPKCDRRNPGFAARLLGVFSVFGTFVLGFPFVAICFPSPGLAQTVISPEESLSSSRPEAWAMRYVSSAARGHSATGFGLRATDVQSGQFELGGELGWLPSLDDDQELIGFDGAKREDLDRTSWVGRLFAAVRLPAGWVLDGGWIPPLSVEGIEPSVGTIGVSRSLLESSSWRIDLRLSGDLGRIEGDITCDRKTVSYGPDPERNPFNCLEPSSDSLTWVSGTLEGTLVWILRDSTLQPYLNVASTYLDAEFQVDARYGSLIDRSLLTTSGSLTTLALGVASQPGSHWRFVGEVAFTPLAVVRDGRRSRDGLLNPRLLASRRF